MQREADSAQEPTAAVRQNPATPTQPRPTSTARVLPTLTPTLAPSPTAAPSVFIRAVNGNVYIRRGPDFGFNQIDVLYKDETAQVIGHDVLYKWAQIIIPDSNSTGWISLQTRYAQLDGNIETVPQVTVNEFPKPAYLRNCTHHRLFIEPGEVFVGPSYTIENEVWLNPGHYWVYDIDMPDPVLIEEVDTREGVVVEIKEDATGEKRNCPK